jgi:hypothetical protein
MHSLFPKTVQEAGGFVLALPNPGRNGFAVEEQGWMVLLFLVGLKIEGERGCFTYGRKDGLAGGSPNSSASSSIRISNIRIQFSCMFLSCEWFQYPSSDGGHALHLSYLEAIDHMFDAAASIHRLPAMCPLLQGFFY